MKSKSVLLAALLATIVGLKSAAAEPISTPVAPATPATTDISRVAALASASNSESYLLALPAVEPVVVAGNLTPMTASELRWAPPVLQTTAYRPRSRYYRRDSGPLLGSSTQIHAGFFDPQGDAGSGFVFGIRGGPMVDPHIQLGLGVDWEHRSQDQDQVVGTSGGPGGTVITTKRQLSSSSENTFPILGTIQVQGDETMAVVPYLGFGGGYEVVTLSATDFLTNNAFDATYGGWGWQAWVGAKIPLSGRAGVVAEGFTNRSEAHRDVFDAISGQTFRETVNLDGFGLRFGLTWGL